MKAVILAGGFGSRLKEKCKNIPKPMIEICGKPILLRQIEMLRREGINDFIFVTYYLSEVIENYFGNGSDFGVNIEYFKEDFPRGTAGALKALELEDDFLLCGGDLIINFSLQRMIDFHRSKNALITMFTHPNTHPYDSTTLLTDNSDSVVGVMDKNHKSEYYPNLCSSGIQLVSPEIFNYIDISDKANFDNDVVAPCVGTGRVFSYKSAEYVFDVGTPERIEKAEHDLKNLFVEKSHFDNPHKAVFVDRDGTINKYKGYINRPEQIELIDGAARAINLFHEKGYLVIVITNQPVVARGDCSLDELDSIHHRLEYLLSKEGAYLDGIYFCPHHPDSGFAGENMKYKIRCNCRKPDVGMIMKAKSDFNIDLSESFMAGDSKVDTETALKSGCRPVFIGEKNDSQTDEIECFSSLYDFSEHLS